MLLPSAANSAADDGGGGSTVGGVGAGKDELDVLALEFDDIEVETVEIEPVADSRPNRCPCLSATSNNADRLLGLADGDEARRRNV